LIDFHQGMDVSDSPESQYWRNSYIRSRGKAIYKTMRYCNNNNIPIVNANYMFGGAVHHDNPIAFENYNIEYYAYGHLAEVCPKKLLPDFGDFETIYIGGASLDQCVFTTRDLSYRKIDHPNKKLILDCCIQTDQYLRRTSATPPHFTCRQSLDEYVRDFLVKEEVDYIDRLVP